MLEFFRLLFAIIVRAILEVVGTEMLETALDFFAVEAK